jgi:hypothetical protein
VPVIGTDVDEPDNWRSSWGEWAAPTLDRLTGAAEGRPTADLAFGAATAGAALNPASARLAAAQRMDIDQRRDGAGIGELSFNGSGPPRKAKESSGCPGRGKKCSLLIPVVPGTAPGNRQQSFL